ncbi:MAG: hypothetical protein C4B59_14155 [Candidatus Methanogaster sp.]|uniref:Uncharacterized protein n=1 Tax=Candidatus Methanogaster sp. TaxID=3386292 RepID=A0AC61KZI3_9EURY|nr:MAG: hypothetical protein C4B59_14155 [ANME-2 cluster archaeon]
MTNNQSYEKCEQNIEKQFGKRNEVEFGKKIPDANINFCALCYMKGFRIRKPKYYKVFDIFDSITVKKVTDFKDKVGRAAEQIEIAYMCISAEKKVETLSFDKTEIFRNNINPPIAILLC